MLGGHLTLGKFSVYWKFCYRHLGNMVNLQRSGGSGKPLFWPHLRMGHGLGVPQGSFKLGGKFSVYWKFCYRHLGNLVNLQRSGGSGKTTFLPTPLPPPQDRKLHGGIKWSYALERSLTLKQLYLGIDLEQTWMKRSKINWKHLESFLIIQKVLTPLTHTHITYFKFMLLITY